jgi:hypothetical protein
LDVEVGKITEMAAQLSGAAAKFWRKWRKERYAHGKGLRTSTLANGVGVGAGKRLSLMAHCLNCFADCLDGRGDDSLRRVRLDVIETAQPSFTQLFAIGEGKAQNVC